MANLSLSLAVRLAAAPLWWFGVQGESLAPAPPAAAAAPAPAPAPGAATQSGVPRSYSQHAFTKIRPGSSLREAPGAAGPVIDLRSSWQHQRDAEVAKHFGRMAELDVIASLAERHNDDSMAELAGEVRRKETERYYRAMYRLRQQSFEAPVAADVLR